MPFTSRIVFLLLLSTALATFSLAQQPKSTAPIPKDELAKWINEHNECGAESPPPYFYRFEPVDFKRDGRPQVIVVASTCMTGTGGPDIHSVYSRDSEGEIIELPVAEPKDPSTYDNLFGNRNYDLVTENGLLVANFEDDPDRAAIPLIIRYQWNGHEFAVASIHKTGVFPTSYDCKDVQKGDVADAICHVAELAALDLQLNAAYKSALARLSTPGREGLKSEQRAWLLHRDKTCAPYKGWIGCLTNLYQERITALKQRAAALTPTATPKS